MMPRHDDTDTLAVRAPWPTAHLWVHAYT